MINFESISGFLLIAVIMIILLRSKWSPVVTLILIPFVFALIMGVDLKSLNGMIKDGIKLVSNNAILFIFSVAFFSFINDTGVFDILVDKLLKISHNNVPLVIIFTGIIAMIAHIDGSTVVTILLTIPALYPVYKKMHIDPRVLLCMTGASMGVMNLLPWGGPVARASSVIHIPGMDAVALWIPLIPMQIMGMVGVIALGIFLGFSQKRKIASLAIKSGTSNQNNLDIHTKFEKEIDLEKEKLKRPKLLWFNIMLCILVLAFLILNIFPSYFTFMVGCSIVLVVNYPSLKEQNARIQAHAGPAILISATILAAGIMVGIMDGTHMVHAMAQTLTSIVPNFLGKFVHIIFGIFALPIGIVVGTDAYFFGLMPPIVEVGKVFGVNPIDTVYSMLIGKNLALLISPLVPATYLALSFTPEVSLAQHIKFSFKYYYILTLIFLGIGILFGIVHL